MAETSFLMEWRVHLMPTAPGRIPVLLLALSGSAAWVWILFRSWLPAAAAIALLIGATREYLFPLNYRITTEGVFVSGALIHSEIKWNAIRRILPDASGVTLTPLATPSRLDAFRGVFIRFAPEGQKGDRASVMELVGQFAPPPHTAPAIEETGS